MITQTSSSALCWAQPLVLNQSEVAADDVDKNDDESLDSAWNPEQFTPNSDWSSCEYDPRHAIVEGIFLSTIAR